MKRIFTLLAALLAIAAYVRPASACTGHTTFRDFPLWTLNDAAANLVFGNITIVSGGTTIETVGACNKLNNTLETFRNGFNPEFYTSLPQDTRLCLHGGNDTVRVLRSGETDTCGVHAMKALNYNGKKLMLVGQAGTDLLTGGTGADILNMVTGDTTGSSNKAVGGPGNDEIRLSSVATSRAWGGSGTDSYFSGGGAGITNRVRDLSGSLDRYNGTDASIDKFCDIGEQAAFAYCGFTTGDKLSVPWLEISCPYVPQTECESMGTIPPPGNE